MHQKQSPLCELSLLKWSYRILSFHTFLTVLIWNHYTNNNMTVPSCIVRFSLEKIEWVCGCFCELLVLLTWNSLDILLKAELNVEQIYKCYQIFVNKIVLIFVRIANFSSSVISADLVWLNRARQLGTVMNKKLGKIEARVGFSNLNDFWA